jgi:ABC-type dipeptide/oligopeptide/nickel transport system permease subunit
LGVLFLAALILFAIFMPMIRTAQLQPPNDPHFDAVFSPIDKPNLSPGQGAAVLGTDDIGRDMLARLAQGARVSLVVGLSVQIVALVFGMLMGVVGVFAPKWVRVPALRLTDAMFAFPDILLAILLVATISPTVFQNVPLVSKLSDEWIGILPVVVALSITAWPSIARLVRVQVASVKDREFVVAARAAGAPTTYLVVKHILPQVLPLILAVSMVEMAGTVLAESSLSFIGIGVQAPNPSWGNMINNARSGDITAHIPQLIAPCILLSLAIFALNFVGDGLQALFDPKARL